MPQAEPWRPIVAVLLSLAVPGLGQVYSGKPMKGLVCLLAMVAIASTIILSAPGVGITITLVLVLLGVAIQIAILADAGLSAERPQDTPKHWYAYLAAGVCFHLIFWPSTIVTVQHQFQGLRTFRHPAESMSPGIMKGDCFLARKVSSPVATPSRGEIIVFPFPEDRTKLFVKRVIGLPGEQIEIKDKQVFIDGKPLKDLWGVHRDSITIPMNVSRRDHMPPLKIPQDSVFVMGDNRDYSLDSRFWGTLKIQDIGWKPLFVYWSDDPSRIDKRLDQ
jgi:signal peptidase I